MTRDQRLAQRVIGTRRGSQLAPGALLFGRRFVMAVEPHPTRPRYFRATGIMTGTRRDWAGDFHSNERLDTWELIGSPWVAP